MTTLVGVIKEKLMVKLPSGRVNGHGGALLGEGTGGVLGGEGGASPDGGEGVRGADLVADWCWGYGRWAGSPS